MLEISGCSAHRFLFESDGRTGDAAVATVRIAVVHVADGRVHEPRVGRIVPNGRPQVA
ncbi:MAG: hypothetical protein II489_00620 [Bacteroidaceae bacterium]|nr:hypothetical protein [Bacteroidaceae bacterium]